MKSHMNQLYVILLCFIIYACSVDGKQDTASKTQDKSADYLNAMRISDELRDNLLDKIDTYFVIMNIERRPPEDPNKLRMPTDYLMMFEQNYLGQKNQYTYHEQQLLNGEVTHSGVQESLVYQTFISGEDTSLVRQFQLHRDSEFLSATPSGKTNFSEHWSMFIYDAPLATEAIDLLLELETWIEFMYYKVNLPETAKIDFSELDGSVAQPVPENAEERLADKTAYLAHYNGHCIDRHYPWGFDGWGICQFWYEPQMRWLTVEIGYSNYYIRFPDN